MKQPSPQNWRTLCGATLALALTLASMTVAAPALYAERDDEEDDGIEEIITTAPKPPQPTAPAPSPSPLPRQEEPLAEPKPEPLRPTPAKQVHHAPAEAAEPVAAEPASAPPNARPPTSDGRPLPFVSVIHSVDPSAPLFTMGKKKIRIVHITTATRFSRIDGQPANFEMMEPGVEVRGSVRKLAQSEWEAVSVKIGSKAAAETATLDD